MSTPWEIFLSQINLVTDSLTVWKTSSKVKTSKSTSKPSKAWMEVSSPTGTIESMFQVEMQRTLETSDQSLTMKSWKDKKNQMKRNQEQ